MPNGQKKGEWKGEKDPGQKSKTERVAKKGAMIIVCSCLERTKGLGATKRWAVNGEKNGSTSLNHDKTTTNSEKVVNL